MSAGALPQRLALVATVLGGLSNIGSAEAQYHAAAPESLDCTTLDCAGVLPGATRFERPEGRPYAVGYAGESDEPVGWVVLSTDVVDVPAYSGKPLVTLVGLTPEGIIAGARVVHHSEPILLVGIPEQELHDFVSFYVGKPADVRVVVGTARGDALQVDVISGATVTALAQNQTILDSARLLGAAVGVVDVAQAGVGHFVEEAEPWTWQRMVDEEVFGRLTVTKAEMGEGESRDAFIDLWFTIADAPQVGRALLGDREYEYRLGQLESGQHLFVILGNGSSSFKGSAFVRGGIFDRVRVEQGLTQVVFRDTDYTNLTIRTPGAPTFREGALFVTRSANIDPGAPYSLVFLGSRYDGRGGFTRDFREFSAEHRLPSSVYYSESRASDAIWVQAWHNNIWDAVILVVFLLFVIGVFVMRKRTTASSKRLRKLHLATMLVSFLMVGVHMGAQPSVTQVLTLLDSIVHEWRFELFASEPLIFIMWVFIFIVSLIWGRGVFCGWVCPYGAMNELVFEVGKRIGIKPRELPEAWHSKLRWVRYFVLAGLIAAFFYDSILGERLAEIEPFKSTFLVPFWNRDVLLIVWWVVLFALALTWHRPFCRYLCPLGAGLAIFNNFRFAGPKRRKFCSSCTICARGCEPRAIRPDGTIDQRECLMCMQCEANYRDDEVCPPLIGVRRLMSKHDARSKQKLAVLNEQIEDV